MANDKQARVVRSKLKNLLESEGFVHSRAIYNRPANDGLVHVITLQLGQRSLAGSCTVNVGVFIPEVHALFNHPRTGDLWDEGFCEIRARIGELAPQRTDHWWPFSDEPEEVADSITLAVSRYALPFLAKLDTRSAIIALWSTLESATPPRRDLSLALILEAAGRRAETNALVDASRLSPNQHLSKLADRVHAHIESRAAV